MFAESANFAGTGPKDFTITVPKEPTSAEAFYTTSNSQYRGDWHQSTLQTMKQLKGKDAPRITDVLAARSTIKKPIRPLVSTAKCVLANAVAEQNAAMLTDKVLSADVIPKKFPVTAGNLEYPKPARKGAENPLYQLSSQEYGKDPPKEHQMPDRFFPGNYQFTSAFMDRKPRYTGLNTGSNPSKIHKNFDGYC